MIFFLGGYRIVMKRYPIFTGDRPLMAIGQTINSRKVISFIDTKGYGSTEPGDTNLSCFPDIFLMFLFAQFSFLTC